MFLSIKNFFRIIIDYKFSLFPLIYFELFYFLKGYKGFKINYSKNDTMTDNIPCPYFFLYKIKKNLTENSFTKLIDLGCGSGRIIDFFNQNFFNKKFVGVEFFSLQYNYCKKIFDNCDNIEIMHSDFTNYDFIKYEADCYFLSAPFKKENDLINFMNKIINLTHKKKILFIIVNYKISTLEKITNLHFVDNFYINEKKGYSICSLNESK